MAFPATAVLECRVTGSDLNGGGFNSARGGTDYSQQDSAVATGTVTSATTTVTATTAIFTSVMVGNYITDGTTWKEITAFTSTTVVTVDSAPAWTTATINVGGALKSPAIAETIVVAGNDVYYKQAGSVFTISSATANVANGRLNLNVSGTAIARIRRIGYTTNRVAGNSDTRPTFQASVGLSSNYIITFNNANSYNSLENVIVDANAQTNSGGMTGSGRCNYSDNCLFKNAGGAINGVNLTNNFSLTRFEVTGCSGGTSGALVINSAANFVFDGSVHDNAARGIDYASGSGMIAFVNSYNNTGANGYGFFFQAAAALIFLNCNSYNNAQDGFYLFTANGLMQCVNCNSANNAGFGYNHNSAQHCLSLYNCSGFSNTSGNYPTTGSTTPQVIQNFKTLSVSPFTAPGSGDFSLNNTAGGGAACRAAGIPGVFPGGLTTGYLDIGAAQHADPAASGGIMLANDFSGGYTG